MQAATIPSVAGDILAQLVSALVSSAGSDLHLRSGSPPFLRAGGQIVSFQSPPLDPMIMKELVRVTAGDMPIPPNAASLEYSFDQPGVARFRVHVFRERGQLAMCLRLVPFRVPTFSELRLPPAIKVLATTTPGLTLVTGATGSGKSTTLASMLQHMATQEAIHVLTIEDPVEYRFEGTRSCVTQRELGRDVQNYHDALKSALREDPDVLFIGEIRDTATMDVALHASESGHAVFSSLHTQNALRTIQRIIGMYPADEQVNARARVSDCLRGSISQALLPRKGLRQRVLATEVLVNNYRVKECIRDPQRTASLAQVLEKSNDQSMHTFDQSLMALARDGMITVETALAHAGSPADFRRSLTLAGIQE